jgi:hypothetical protein
MLYMLSIYAHCYDAILYYMGTIMGTNAMLYCMGTIMGTIDMGTIGINLYQHIVTARTSYAIGLKHNMCLFRDDNIHVIMCSLASQTSRQ